MFAYAPKVYCDYLKTRLPPAVRVAGDVPATRPARLVTVRSAPAGSSSKAQVLSWRRLVFQCWDVDEIAAGELCELVRDLVADSKYAGIGVRKVKIIGEPGRNDDPDDSSPRFQMTVDALMRSKH